MIIILTEAGIELRQGTEVFYPASEKHSHNIISTALKKFGKLSPETAIELLQQGINCECAFIFKDKAYFME